MPNSTWSKLRPHQGSFTHHALLCTHRLPSHSSVLCPSVSSSFNVTVVIDQL